MPTPVPGYGYYQRLYRPNGGTHDSVVGFGFRNNPGNTAAATIGSLRTACSTAGSMFSTAACSTEWTWVGDYCLISSAFGVLTSSGSVVSVAGTNVPLPPPANVSAVISKNTDLAGRQFRGRLAYPAAFLDEAEIDAAGFLAGPEQTDIQNRANTLMSNLAAATLPMYLLHGPNKLGVTPLPTLVQSLECQGLVGSQRNRIR